MLGFGTFTIELIALIVELINRNQPKNNRHSSGKLAIILI